MDASSGGHVLGESPTTLSRDTTHHMGPEQELRGAASGITDRMRQAATNAEVSEDRRFNQTCYFHPKLHRAEPQALAAEQGDMSGQANHRTRWKTQPNPVLGFKLLKQLPGSTPFP